MTTRDVEEQAYYSSQKVLQQTKSFLENKTTSIKNEIFSFSLNETVQKLCLTPASYYQREIANWINDSDKYKQLALTLYYNTDISLAQLYVKNGIADILDSNEFQRVATIENAAWYEDMISHRETGKWLPPDNFPQSGNTRYIYYFHGVKGDKSVTDFIGLIRADVDEALIKNILDQAVYTKSTSVYLINSNDELVSSSTNVFSDVSDIITTMDQIGYSNIYSGVWENVSIGGEKYLFGAQNVSNSDWRLIMTIPYKEILDLSVKTRNRMIVILLAVLPLILMISFFAASTSTKRIRKLIPHMRNVGKGDFNVSILPSNNDEIGVLTRNFNQMLTKMALLLEDTYKLGNANKDLELKALQAQINPHFLYNSLDLVNCISIKHNIPEIGQMVEALAKFYKLSLSKGEDIVSIQNELEHVMCYVQVQNMRFDHKIQFEINVPDHLQQFSIPKIILQPLVENSIFHGIFQKEDECGTIQILGYTDAKTITLEVRDDGVGIPETELPVILSDKNSNEAHGYGIKNVNERLKINYGNEYGLEYHSTQNIGTTVCIRIPAIEYEHHCHS